MYFPRLRDLREDKDLRQQDIADYLHISQTVYSRYERGAQTIPLVHLLRLADFYGAHQRPPSISAEAPHLTALFCAKSLVFSARMRYTKVLEATMEDMV